MWHVDVPTTKMSGRKKKVKKKNIPPPRIWARPEREGVIDNFGSGSNRRMPTGTIPRQEQHLARILRDDASFAEEDDENKEQEYDEDEEDEEDDEDDEDEEDEEDDEDEEDEENDGSCETCWALLAPEW